MEVTLFPTLEEALELHLKLLEKFGGKPGVRDMGLLQSAIARPQSGYYETLSLQAAALLQSLTQNHAMIDGNKRLAFALTAIFLKMNGYDLKVSADEGETFIINDLIKNRVDLEVIRDWLEPHMKKKKRS